MFDHPIAVAAGLVLAGAFVAIVLVLAVFEVGRAGYEFDSDDA